MRKHKLYIQQKRRGFGSSSYMGEKELMRMCPSLAFLLYRVSSIIQKETSTSLQDVVY